MRLFPPASAVKSIKSVPSVCVCVCASVSSLTAEPFDVGTQNVHGCYLLSWIDGA